MKPKNTYKILGPIETNIVARLTYEKRLLLQRIGYSIYVVGYCV